jgi:mechanosensitive ion channel-like protein
MRYLAVDFQQGVSDAWSDVAAFVPKLVGAIVILVVGWFVARLLAKIVDRVLERVGFDRAVERGGLRQALARSKYDPSDILAKIVFWAVILIALQLAFGVFGPNPVSDLLRGIIAYLPNVIVAIVILVIAGALAKGARDLLESMLSGVSFGRALATGAGVAILIVGVFAALDQLEIAPAIVTGLWYAILAIVAGSAVIAFGVGGIPIARRYLERATQRAEERAPEVRAHVEQSRIDLTDTPTTATYPTEPGDDPAARRLE